MQGIIWGEPDLTAELLLVLFNVWIALCITFACNT